MATIPNPRTWASGDTVTGTEFNSDVRDAQQFLLHRPRVLVYDSAGVTSTNTNTLHTWNSELFDTEGMHSVSSFTSRLTALTAGVYEIVLHIDWQPLAPASNGATRIATVQKNNSGGTTLGGTPEIGCDMEYIHPFDGAGVQTNHLVIQNFLAAGDYVEAVVLNTLGSATLSTYNGFSHIQTYFGARWIGLA